MAQIAFEGNLVAPAELKFAQSGKAVAKARIAENHRGKNQQTGEWEDQGTTWHNVTAFGALAEKLAEVSKGQRLTVQGRQSSRAYEKDGEQRQWTETIADVFGVVPKRDQQQGSGGYQQTPQSQAAGWGGQQAPQQSPQGGWPAAVQPGQGQPQQGQWGGGGQQGGFDQDPPW